MAKACAAVMASPRLLTDPEPFTCRGGPFPSWDLTITGRLRGKPLFDFVSTCWTPQMGLIGTLGLAPILHAHLLARRRGRLTGGESRTFTDLRPGDLVSCVFADNELDLGVPTDTDGGRSSVGFTGGVVGINAVTLKIAVKGDRVVASCS
ncbi:MAG TPA: hypothetical protein VLJ76_08770 [Gaiellaceae bacterium]|nr:hypothetical protein [Gaiellaceae bacterium]